MTTTLVDDLRTARSRGVRPEAPDADLRGADLRDSPSSCAACLTVSRSGVVVGMSVKLRHCLV